MDSAEVNEYLSELYNNVDKYESAFTGIQNVFKKAKEKYPDVTLNYVKKWLKSQETYGVHYPYRKKIQRSRVIVGGKDYMWEVDLMDMLSLSNFNDGFKYVLLVIDDFSRYIWTCCITNKKPIEVVKCLTKIFAESGRKPKYIRSDNGSEFIGSVMQKFLKGKGVKHITTRSEIKAAFAERAIKTIKGRLFKYMYHKQTFKYFTVLKSVTNNYNNSVHSSTKMKPTEVTEKNEAKLWGQMYASLSNPLLRKGDGDILNVGDYVRISFLKTVFSREYRQKWSSEIFQIYRRSLRDGVMVYWIRDLGGEEVEGSFYRAEIQPTISNKDTLYKVEKIIKSKKDKKQGTMHLVKWLNWPSKFNSWIRADDIENI